MSARYLVRFDDICPTMNWSAWRSLEQAIRDHGIAPILAVVPDNQDEKLNVGAPRQDFWAWVRDRQKEGWCIGLHGYQHRYETQSPGIMGINPYSEFAGLPEDVQRAKLVRALEIFQDNGVRADVWVAPAHSFDDVTVRCLVELGIDTISDGFYFRPVRRMGAYWIPQQLWHFRPMPFGVWTVCLHCNSYKEAEIEAICRQIAKYAPRICSVGDVKRMYAAAAESLSDRCFASLVPQARRLRRWMRHR